MPPAKYILCIYLPHWAITRRFRRRPEATRQPLAVIHTFSQRREVIDATPAARSSGVRAGMTAAEAKALCPAVVCLDHDAAADARSLDALGRWLIRFTPVVARGWEPIDDETVEPALFLDLTGCERLFGGLPRLVGLIQYALRRLGIQMRCAVAPTPGGAWALARISLKKQPIMTSQSLAAAIPLMPLETLRVGPATIAGLHQLGIKTVGDLLCLPRDELPSRFGRGLLKRIDQFTGALHEPLTKLVVESPIGARVDFEFSIDRQEDIHCVFEKLLGDVAAELTRRNHGVRQLRLSLHPDRGWGRPVETRTISLSRPHRERATLLSLIRCEIERIDLEHGFTRFELEVPRHEPVADAQVHFFEQRLVDEQRELDRLMERLAARLGPQAIVRPKMVESYLPERAWRPAGEDEPLGTLALIRPRPLTLLPTPAEILVTCEPSDDRTGKPRQFGWKGMLHRLTQIVGPERIAGEWWRGHRRTRDYYDVESETGQRFWIFRVILTRDQEVFARWFLHGCFE